MALQAAAVTPLGLRWDRKWAVVRSDNGRFVTQRQYPKMALIEALLPAEALAGEWGAVAPEAALTVRCPGQPPMQVPLMPQAHARKAMQVSGGGHERRTADSVYVA